MTDERRATNVKITAPDAEQLATVTTPAELARCMKQLNQAGESLSVRDLETWGMNRGLPMRRATVGDALSGKRPPSAQLLRGFLAAMRVQDEMLVSAWLDALERVMAAQPGTRQRGYADRATGPVPAHSFFVETDDVDEIYRSVANAREQVWLLGTTLSRHIPYLQESLRRAVTNKCAVRILLIKPGSAAMDMSVLRAGPLGLGLRQQEEQLTNNLRILREVAESGNGLEVRLIDYLAPYTLYAYDPGLDTGRMEMRLGSFHGEHHLRPTFRVERSRDEVWFDYFYEQFVSMWDAADRYDLDNKSVC
ncbi:hypothetical protein [Nucisporomicrobium flavum]|uniref:hypothetical protein n=1 Tax=Nucisporomicrobium flavum TaxID=2785915 RepID=UPI0018F594AD|nr:hypothetical protein [Nucisporomicrobium flavum]